MKILDNINNPSDIKNLNIKELSTLCQEIREYMIECCSENPGHLGASLGSVETSVALHYVFNTPTDKIVWDVGHQAYAHKIITGRKEKFKLNRKYKGLSGFPKITESQYDSFGGGHTSTSVSAALGMAEAARIKKEDIEVIAIIGDGAMTGGLAFEGLNNAGYLKSNILVILNDNQISIDKNVGALHKNFVKLSTSHTYNKIKNTIWNVLGNNSIRKVLQKFTLSTKLALTKRGTIFEGLGFRYFGTIDGNDIGQMVTTLSNLKEIKGPKLLHIRTTKGKGYKPAEEDPSKWHAPGRFNIDTGERKTPLNNKARYQDVFGDTIVELAKNNEKIVGITPAMASGCSLTKMLTIFPDRSFDVGIAEQHAVTFSGGLASQGMLPYCNIYSTFMQRAFDNIIHDIALQNLKVVFCIDRGGLVGEDGATHHGAFDLSYFRLIPNITIAAPINEVELRNMLYSASLPSYGITTIRYPRGYGEGVNWMQPFQKIENGKAELISDGEKIGILSIGTIGNKCIEATNKLIKDNITPLHYNMRFLKPIDTDAIDNACKKCKILITIEDGTIIGGLYGAICEYIASTHHHVKVIPMGIPDRFIDQGSIDELMDECGYSASNIYLRIKNVWNNTAEKERLSK